MPTLRETIKLEVESLRQYFGWGPNSEQANSVNNSLVSIAHLASNMGRDLALIEVLNMKKEAVVELEAMLAPISVVASSDMKQDTTRTRRLQYVSVEDIKKLK